LTYEEFLSVLKYLQLVFTNHYRDIQKHWA